MAPKDTNGSGGKGRKGRGSREKRVKSSGMWAVLSSTGRRKDRDDRWGLDVTEIENLQDTTMASVPGMRKKRGGERDGLLEKLKELTVRLGECIDTYAMPLWREMARKGAEEEIRKGHKDRAAAYDAEKWKRDLLEIFYDTIHNHETRWGAYWDEEIAEKFRLLFLYSACYAVRKHASQKPRKTGEPYVMHPFRVAQIAAEKGLDGKGIAAAYLHDVVEDTDTPIEEIRRKFGSTIATVVEAVSKVKYRPADDASEEDIRLLKDKSKVDTYKKILGTAEGVNLLRAVILKIFDRLDNMRTVGVFQGYKRKRYAWETLTIYCTLALELGMNEVARELTERSLRAIYGDAVIDAHRSRVQSQIIAHRRILTETTKILEEVLESHGIRDVQIMKVEKAPLWAYYDFVRREFRKRAAFLRIRIVVRNTEELYRALGAIHLSGELSPLFKEIDELRYIQRTDAYKVHSHMMRDYVTSPLPNGYTALLTAIEMNNTTIRLELLTPRMLDINEKGVLARFTDPDIQEAYGQHLETMYKLIRNIPGISYEQLQELMMQSSQGMVVVYDEEGRSQELPHGATIMDYAYMVARDQALMCRGAYINKTFQPPDYVLNVGDTVRLVFGDDAYIRPSLLCKMRDLTALKTYSDDMRDYLDAVALEEGRKVVTDLGIANGVEPSVLLRMLSRADLIDIGYGRTTARDRLEERNPALFVKGAVFARMNVPVVPRKVEPFGHPFYRMCPHCNVLPWMGDTVAQFSFESSIDECAARHKISLVFLHTSGCAHVDHSKPRFRVEWGTDIPDNLSLSMKVVDEIGMAARIINHISSKGFNIVSLNVSDERDENGMASLCVKIDTTTIKHDNARTRKLAELFDTLRTLRGVGRIRVHMDEEV